MPRLPLDFPSRVALLYLSAALVYIFVSDRLLIATLRNPDAIAFWQTFKGVGFVAATTLLLFVVLRLEARFRAQVESAHREERDRVRLLVEQAQDLVYRYRLTQPRGFEYVSPAATVMTGYTPEELYARPELVRELVHEVDRHLLSEGLQRGFDKPLVLRLKRRDGSLLWTEQRNRLVYGPGQEPVAIEGIARDISASELAKAQLEQALDAEQQARVLVEHEARRADTLQAITAAFAGALTPNDVVTAIFDHGLWATGAHGSVVSMLDEHGESLEIIGHSGRSSEELEKYRVLPIDLHSAPTEVVRTGKAVWISSLEEAETRFPGSRAILENFGDRSLAILPLVSAGRPIGAVSFSFALERNFEAEERAFMTNLAQQCAVTLERSELFTKVRASQRRLRALSQRVLDAQEQERRHIARELHDEVGQVLGALKINLHLLRTSTEGPGTRARFDESLAILDRLLGQIRALSLELRPSILDDQGLGEALQWFAERVAERSGLEISITNDLNDQQVPPDVANACFRIAQEALNNAVRHAQATRLELRATLQDDILDLSIRDDGVGFDVEAQRKRALSGTSLGLLSLGERAELAGGHTEITSSEGAGTQVRARFDLGRSRKKPHKSMQADAG